MTEKKEVHGTISSLSGAIVIAGLTGNLEGERCPIGVGHDEERGSGMTRGKVRCPIGVGHDEGGKGMVQYRHCRYHISSLPA